MVSAVDRVIDYTARKYESARDSYWAYVPNDNGKGISYGFIQFNQQVGELPALFKEMSKLAPSKFSQLFGSYAPKMLQETWVRTSDLAGDADFVARLRVSGQEPEFQQAQRNLAKRKYFDPTALTVKNLGLKSERAYAMAYDTAVQRGAGTANRLLIEAAKATPAAPDWERQVLGKFAVTSDTTTAAGVVNRRKQMLTDLGLSDAALFAAGAGLTTLLLVGAGVWWYLKYQA